jgi:hypothetical protein
MQRTREHLFPASLHQRMLALGPPKANRFWLRKIDQEIKGEPVIKDVCVGCNNGPLSLLDAYAVRMFDQHCAQILQKGEIVTFEYEYHLLKRWLLKMSFNSARLHLSKDLDAYGRLLPYILWGHQLTGRTVRLYLQLSYPGAVSQTDRDLYLEGGEEPKIWEPRLNRIGLVWLTLEGRNKLLRMVHLQSYTFYLAFTEPGSGASAAKEFSAVFTRHSPGTVELLASRPKVTLSCAGLDAWRAFKGSRQNSLV